jgi:hypothetical protein
VLEEITNTKPEMLMLPEIESDFEDESSESPESSTKSNDRVFLPVVEFGEN